MQPTTGGLVGAVQTQKVNQFPKEPIDRQDSAVAQVQSKLEQLRRESSMVVERMERALARWHGPKPEDPKCSPVDSVPGSMNNAVWGEITWIENNIKAQQALLSEIDKII